MPVKIVDNTHGSTDCANGTIRENDVLKMKQDFQDQVGVTAIPPRDGIIKKHSFYFSRAQVNELMDHYNETFDAIEISIGVQIRETIIDCEKVNQPQKQFDESDCLAVIISMAQIETLEPENGVDDYVLINGYKEPGHGIAPTPCCPGSKPPPYNA